MKIDSSLSKLITFPRIIPKTFLNSMIKVNNNNFLVLPCQAPSGHSLYYIIIKLHIQYIILIQKDLNMTITILCLCDCLWRGRKALAWCQANGDSGASVPSSRVCHWSVRPLSHPTTNTACIPSTALLQVFTSI